MDGSIQSASGRYCKARRRGKSSGRISSAGLTKTKITGRYWYIISEQFGVKCNRRESKWSKEGEARRKNKYESGKVTKRNERVTPVDRHREYIRNWTNQREENKQYKKQDGTAT